MVKGYTWYLLKIFQKKEVGTQGEENKQNQQTIDRYNKACYTILFWSMFKIFHNEMLTTVLKLLQIICPKILI